MGVHWELSLSMFTTVWKKIDHSRENDVEVPIRAEMRKRMCVCEGGGMWGRGEKERERKEAGERVVSSFPKAQLYDCILVFPRYGKYYRILSVP